MLIGEEVTIEDMMFCRDRRAEMQRNFIEKYHSPVLSFTLNIPGPVKTNAQLQSCFADAVYAIHAVLADHNAPILESVTYHDKTGDELLLCFQGDANAVKDSMTLLEERMPLGRLYDIDIINTNGEKLSRNVYRKCLICDRQAQECAHSRNHTIEEMQGKILSMLKKAGY